MFSASGTPTRNNFASFLLPTAFLKIGAYTIVGAFYNKIGASHMLIHGYLLYFIAVPQHFLVSMVTSIHMQSVLIGSEYPVMDTLLFYVMQLFSGAMPQARFAVRRR